MSERKNNGKSREYNPSGRRWWLKLEYAFFFDKRVCALRRKLGDRALIFYEKIMLRSLENSCTMKFEGLEETFEEEIAVDIMEDSGDSVQLIREIMDFLIQHRLMVEQADKSFLFTQAAEMSGDECSSAERMRRMRARRKEASHDEYDSDENLSHNDNNSSQSNGMSQCDSSPSKRYHIQNQNNNRSRAKSRIDLDLELELKQKTETEEADSDFVSAELAASAAADAAAPPAGDLFSLEKLLDIRSKNDINLSGDGVMAFLTEMTASGWMLYKKPVTKAGIVKALRGWAKYHEDYHLGDDVKLEKKIVKVLKELLGNDKAEEFLNCDDIDYQLALLKDCPVEAFTDEMLEYMTEEWGIPFDSSGDET